MRVQLFSQYWNSPDNKSVTGVPVYVSNNSCLPKPHISMNKALLSMSARLLLALVSTHILYSNKNWTVIHYTRYKDSVMSV